MESISELSILIPTYNQECTRLVETLHQQARQIDGLLFEIIVAEDGSTDPVSLEANSPIDRLSGCRHIVRETNVGRAAIRNFLAHEARYRWLLFIDSRMRVGDGTFLRTYLAHPDHDIVYGGYWVEENASLNGNLRYLYERQFLLSHPASERQRHPYADFHTSNFMARCEILLSIPFDERFKHYGYEDVLYGKQLEENSVKILHVDNPVLFDKFEDNTQFLTKTEEALRTLYTFRTELSEHSRMLRLCDRLRRCYLLWVVRWAYRLRGNAWRKRCEGSSPRLRSFHLYRLGYFVSLFATSPRKRPRQSANMP